MKNYSIIIFVLILFVTVSASFAPVTQRDGDFENLQVLPKDISDAQLDSVMDHFKTSLGVKCSFCHAQAKDTSAGRHLDFASDERPEKLRAREMFRMTSYLNANYFNPEHSTRTDTIHEVICYTCHRGNKEPDSEIFFMEIDSILKAQHQRKK